jgi:hypothetical protein
VAINKHRERNRVSYDVLNILSYVDLFYDKKARKNIQRKFKEPAKAERLIARKEDADVNDTVHSLTSVRWTTDGKMRELHGHLEVLCRTKIIPFRGD